MFDVDVASSSARRAPCSYLVRKGVENSPEELLGEEELFLRGRAEAAHARGQAVVLPVLLVVVDQELEGVGTRERSRNMEKKNIIVLHFVDTWVKTGDAQF